MPLKIISRIIPNWGVTYGPTGDGPFPGILILHGSDGARRRFARGAVSDVAFWLLEERQSLERGNHSRVVGSK
jgi:hypothetical protein